jgi:hypothetical protein
MTQITTTILALVLFTAMPAPNAHAIETNALYDEAAAVRSQCDFRSDMRKLWEDHVTWTRLFIISATSNAPDKDAATKRLLRNQVDIGDAIKPYYGVEAGKKLTALLTDHILIAADIVTAAKAKRSDLVKRHAARWTANADDISSFLSQANPRYWPLGQMKHMMHMHLELTTAELNAHLAQSWEQEVAIYDRVHNEILQMADMLAFGIIQQFPRQFR